MIFSTGPKLARTAVRVAVRNVRGRNHYTGAIALCSTLASQAHGYWPKT
jgi:hypothetical protein